ncbi:MAG: vitamin B12-dependent ribonucleotide reductase [Candidatus Anstonellaceae archaeon]
MRGFWEGDKMEEIQEKNQTFFKRETNGLRIERVFTKEDQDVFSMFEYEIRSSIIRDVDGSIVYEMDNVEIPKGWSQVATDILAQKYFRKTQVPQRDKDGKIKIDPKTGQPILGPENSIKQVVKRLASTWRWWGEKYGYFASIEDAEAFEDEIIYMLLNQMAAPNSPQWFNNGLAHCYGIKGSPQGHYYVDPKNGEVKPAEDAYTHPQLHACFIQSLKDDLVNEGGIFDLLTREARLFKYGSGTGTNFSVLRGAGEPLSGGGKSSGLMSFLKIYDRAAGSIKSGGTTRRAAKMVIVDIDHPDIEEFINWKMEEEKKVAALYSGAHSMRKTLNKIMQVAKEENSTDFKTNKRLKQAVAEALACNVPINYILRVLSLVQQGIYKFDMPVYDLNFEGEAYLTVSGQNSNNSVRISNAFMNALREDGNWQLIRRTDRKVAKEVKAKKLWEQIAYAAWNCADPGVQFDDTINEWNTCLNDGRINASNPCSEYMFLDDTACNLASLNLVKFLDEETGVFKVKEFMHAIRLWTIVLEISVLMAGYPSKEIARRSYMYRTLGLGYANLGSLLMILGVPYDSPEALAIAGCISAILTGKAYETSAEMAMHLGPFEAYERNKEHMLRVIRNHRRAAYNVDKSEYEGLTITPMGIDPKYAPSYLVKEAQEVWDRALELGQKYGYRNAHVTVIAPTGTIGLLMDCDTTGIEPDYAIVKFKKLAGGGYFKIVNQSVKKALKRLGYTKAQIDEIENYCKGHATLAGCPTINRERLKESGFTDEKVDLVEKQLPYVFDINDAFNKYVLGVDFLKSLGVSDKDLDNPQFKLLKFLGFSDEEIEKANEYVCGTMTIEGAPHLKVEHYPIFDCASKCGKKGTRAIHYKAHIRMMAAVQPFISGSISKTINMPQETTIEDVKEAYELSYLLMLKCISIYRDGSKLSQPLLSLSESEQENVKALAQLSQEVQSLFGDYMQRPILSTLQRRKLPPKRRGFVQEAKIGGHKVYLKTGEYPDGTLGEIFIDMYKEGAGYRALLNCFAIAVSKGLQYGVPLEEFVDTFVFTKFEPYGIVTGHEAIKSATSVIDYVFRVLGYEYLHRTDFVHVKPSPLEKEMQVKLVEPNKSNQQSIKKEEMQRESSAEKEEMVKEAKALGYSGDQCPSCGSMKMKRNGTCLVCLDCGETTGCS